MSAVQTLVALLRDPQGADAVDPAHWTEVLAVARAETLAGTLAHRLAGLALPDMVAGALAEARIDADEARRTALWEANRVALALRPLGHPVVLLKGTAFVAAGLAAGQGGASATAISCFHASCSTMPRSCWSTPGGSG